MAMLIVGLHLHLVLVMPVATWNRCVLAHGLRRTITRVQDLYTRGGPVGWGRKSIRRRGTPWGQREATIRGITCQRGGSPDGKP